jgi:carbonic anhydrase
MFKKCFLYLSIFISHTTFGQANTIPLEVTKDIERLQRHEQIYINKKGPLFFKRLSRGQSPLFTIVACSDSRVQANILDDNPEGVFFMVRNIGNQLNTAMGSVDYGVSHLNTEILLIIGHSECGAIDAVISGYKDIEPDIFKELKTIHIKKGSSNIEGVLENVDNQVDEALKKYAQKIKKKRLVVIGAVYDFANAMKQGNGELHIININGETNPAKLKKIIDKKIM